MNNMCSVKFFIILVCYYNSLCFVDASRNFFQINKTESDISEGNFPYYKITFLCLSILYVLFTIWYIVWIESIIINKACIYDELMDNSCIYDKETQEIDESKLSIYTGLVNKMNNNEAFNIFKADIIDRVLVLKIRVSIYNGNEWKECKDLQEDYYREIEFDKKIGIDKELLNKLTLCTLTLDECEIHLLSAFLIGKQIYKMFVCENIIYLLHCDESLNTNETVNKLRNNEYKFNQNDKSLKITILLSENQIFTLIGRLQKGDQSNTFNLVKFESKIKEKSVLYHCPSIKNNTYYELIPDRFTLRDILQYYKKKKSINNWLLRIFALVLHFSSIFTVVICLNTMNNYILFDREIKTIILLLFSFLFAFASYLFFFGIAWIKLRPLILIILLGYIFILIYLTILLRNLYLLEYQDVSPNGFEQIR